MKKVYGSRYGLIALALGLVIGCGGGSTDGDTADDEMLADDQSAPIDSDGSDVDSADESEDNTSSEGDSDSASDSDADDSNADDSNADDSDADDSDADDSDADDSNDTSDDDEDSNPGAQIDADSNSNSTDISGSGSLFGNVDLAQDGSFASAAFYRADINVPFSSLTAETVPSTDTCFVSDFNFSNSVSDTLTPPDFDFNFESVSAGEVLTLTSPAGSFGELQRMTAQGFVDYGLIEGENLPGPVPSSTTLNIPGDEFPAFSSVALPNVPALDDFVASTGMTVTPDTTFSWTAAGSDSNSLSLSVTSFPMIIGPDFDPADLSLISVSCTLVDDGSFSFPASIQAEMSTSFSAVSFAASRSAFRVVQSGGAVLTVSVTAGN